MYYINTSDVCIYCIIYMQIRWCSGQICQWSSNERFARFPSMVVSADSKCKTHKLYTCNLQQWLHNRGIVEAFLFHVSYFGGTSGYSICFCTFNWLHSPSHGAEADYLHLSRLGNQLDYKTATNRSPRARVLSITSACLTPASNPAQHSHCHLVWKRIHPPCPPTMDRLTAPGPCFPSFPEHRLLHWFWLSCILGSKPTYLS